MVGKKNQSALLAKYFGLYKKNPRSKVFAPLAESFRKLGMYDDAYKVLKEGIRNHPDYPLGYIVLAHCYYDQQRFELTYNTLRPIISKNADNISLQKIFAQACIHMGHLEEALDTYKYLLFMNPKDKFFAAQVKKLEDDLMIGHKKFNLDQIIKAPGVINLSEGTQNLIIDAKTEVSDDDWVQVDFGQKPVPIEAPKTLPNAHESDEEDWVMGRPGAGMPNLTMAEAIEERPGLSEHPILKNQEIKKRDLEDEYYADEFEQEHGDVEDVNAESIFHETPLVSHTLIDLYCAQEYFDKAIELLNKLIELNPHDLESANKLRYVEKLKEEKRPGLRVVTEQDGHDELISIIESQVKARSPKELIIEARFNDFLVAIKERAQEQR